MANRGDYYKSRTKKWLESKGYQVAFLERTMWIPVKDGSGRMIPVKKDQFGSDLLAVSESDIIFVQVKFNAKVASKNVAAAREEFKRFKFPKYSRQWIVVWRFRVREPIIEQIGGALGARKLSTV